MSTLIVSHSSGDDDLVARIVADLEARGHVVWVDLARLHGGDSLAASIQRGIEEADGFLLLYSHRAMESRWVKTERDAAFSRSVRDESFVFIPARLDDAEVPLLLASKKWIDFQAASKER